MIKIDESGGARSALVVRGIAKQELSMSDTWMYSIARPSRAMTKWDNKYDEKAP